MNDKKMKEIVETMSKLMGIEAKDFVQKGSVISVVAFIQKNKLEGGEPLKIFEAAIKEKLGKHLDTMSTQQYASIRARFLEDVFPVAIKDNLLTKDLHLTEMGKHIAAQWNKMLEL